VTDPAEAVLGSILLDNAAIYAVADILCPADFELGSDAELFSRMVALSSSGRPIDLVTLDGAVDPARFALLLDAVPTAKHAPHYAAQVLAASQRRRLRAVGEEMAASADDERPVDLLIAQAEAAVMGVRRFSVSSDFVSAGEQAARLYSLYEERASEPGAMLGRPTGIKGLDDLQSGLSQTDLVVIAGRPAMGKSAIAQQIILNLLRADRGAVGILFSLEMSSDQCVTRAQAQISGLDSRRIQTGRLNDREWGDLADACRDLERMQFWIDGSGYQSMQTIGSRCRAIKGRLGRLDIVAVDYLQLIAQDSRAGNREQAIAQASRDAKLLAKELSVPVLLLSQLNRGLESRDDKRPRMSDLRESGAIEQDADEILFVYRDIVYNEGADPNEAEIIVAKNRDGATGKCFVRFEEKSTRFHD